MAGRGISYPSRGCFDEWETNAEVWEGGGDTWAAKDKEEEILVISSIEGNASSSSKARIMNAGDKAKPDIVAVVDAMKEIERASDEIREEEKAL